MTRRPRDQERWGRRLRRWPEAELDASVTGLVAPRGASEFRLAPRTGRCVNGAIAAVIACGVFVAWVALVCLIGPEDARRRRVRVSIVQRVTWAMQEIAAAFSLLVLAAKAATRSMQAFALALGRGHSGHGRRSLGCVVERTFRDDSAD